MMSSGVPLAPQRLDRIVDEVLSSAAPALAASQVGINRQYDPNLPEYPMDRALVREAVAILLDAAIKRIHPDRVLRVTLRANRNALMFALKAPGDGIPAAERETLFTGEPRPGTLARARDCIGEHGGVVWANGIAGLGITFYFTLPTRLPRLTT